MINKIKKILGMKKTQKDQDYYLTQLKNHTHLLEIYKQFNQNDGKIIKNEERIILEIIEKLDDAIYDKDIEWSRSVILNNDHMLDSINNLETTNNKVLQNILTRRSIRSFKQNIPSKELIDLIIESGQWAPSSCNRQSCYFTIAKPKGKKRIFQVAPIAIYISINTQHHPNEKYTMAMDVGVAMQNMMLLTHSLGLGSCMVYLSEYENQDIMRQYLRLPKEHYVFAALLVGHIDKRNSRTPPRKPLEHQRKYIINYE